MIYIINVNELDSLRLGYDGRVRNLQKIFNKSGIKNLAITNNVGHIDKVRHTNLRYPGYKVIKTLQYKENLSILRFLSNIIFSLKLFFYLATRLKNNDRVVVNSIPPEILYSISFLKKIKRGKFKIILDVRDLWPYAYKKNKESFAIKLWGYLCTFLMKSGLKSVSHSLVVSKQFINVLKELGYKKECTFLPLGFDKDRWVPAQTYKIHSLAGFYIGNENNQIDLNATLKELDGFFEKIFIVGKHDKKISLKKTILLYEGVKDPTFINQLTRSCHFGILPSLEKSGAGLPNKLFDYMGASLPIITFGNDEAAKFITSHKIGLVHSRTLESCYAINHYSFFKDNLNKLRNFYSTDHLYEKYKEIVLK